jgi:HK97 family phage major capsid protein
MDERTTLEELAARRDEVIARMREIHGEAQGRRFEDNEQAEFDDLEGERIQIDLAIENIEERESRLASANGNQVISGDGTTPVRKRKNRGGVYSNTGTKMPENIFDLTAYRGLGSSVEEMKHLYREGARRAVENLQFESETPEKAKAHAEKLLMRDERDAAFATRVLTTGSALYDRAFGKMVMGKPLSTQEDAALKAAISNTGLGSETPVPVTIDPTVILTSDGAVNPLRQIARTVTITGSKWQGISSDGVDVVYEAELTQVADTTPVFEAPQAEVAKAHAYIEFSIEVDQDWGELRSNLGIMFQDAKDMKEAEKFLLGSGVNEPEGLLTALIASPASIVYTATLNTFTDADLYAVKAALPPRFRSGASWLANDAVFSAVRQFDTAGGAALWVQLEADRPARLLGRPVYEASEMSGEYTSGNEEILVYGDFGRGFIIVDRVGLNVELIPHVLGVNRRPIGARALYAYFRNTSALLTANAFRVLTVKPT